MGRVPTWVGKGRVVGRVTPPARVAAGTISCTQATSEFKLALVGVFKLPLLGDALSSKGDARPPVTGLASPAARAGGATASIQSGASIIAYSAASSAFAAFRSRVSKPSVNQA